MSFHWMRPSFFCALLMLALPFAACDDGGKDDDDEPPTPAERLCGALASAIQGCGSATPCDEALVKDCASIAGIMSDPYLDAAATCIEKGGVPQQCFVDALGSLKPTAAHAAFGKQFCAECALGVPGCEEALFGGGGGSGDLAIAGKLIMPFGDQLVGEIAAECASGLTCAATFLSCAQGVIAKRAIPENTLSCLLDVLTGNVEPGMESDCSSSNSSSSGSGGGGTGCVDGEDCAAAEVCDFDTLRCDASQCATGMPCAMGEVCIEQVPMSGSGACYPGCTPFAGGCADGQECIDLTGEGQSGLCLRTADSTLGQPCEHHDTTSGCVSGQFCADQGNGPECLEQCNFWGASATCSNAAQSCIFQSACVDVEVSDPAGIGESCTAVAGTSCAPLGERLLGSCQDLGAGLECLAFCRTASSDCPGGETCSAFGDGVFGVCVP